VILSPRYDHTTRHPDSPHRKGQKLEHETFYVLESLLPSRQDVAEGTRGNHLRLGSRVAEFLSNCLACSRQPIMEDYK